MSTRPRRRWRGFCARPGLTKDQLEARDDKKGQVWFAVIEKPGRSAADVIAEAVTETIQGFPWPKSMRWGDGDLRWVRPLHSILCVLTDEAGAEVVPFEVGGIASGDKSFGHRFMAPDPISATGFEDYAEKLAAAHVILDPADRAARIEHDAKQLAFAQGLEVVEDSGLLAEVAGLVEWPVTLMGEIDAQFLDLPPEVLQTSMKAHQKFFSVRNPKTGKIERFITVANTETPDNGATILAGNGARLDRAPGRCAVLLGERFEEVAGRDGRAAEGRGIPREARHPGRTDRAHCGPGPGDCPNGRRRRGPGRAGGAGREGRPRLRDGLRVPGTPGA